MLTPEQWRAVMVCAAAVADAAQDNSAGLCVDLGDKRQLRLREMGTKLCVDVREMYEKDNELAPGKKGAI